jgi:outer membrane murein-binding lipoprotein Lpp
MLQKLVIALFTLILLLGIGQHGAVPQTFSNVDARVSNLQSQVYQLRAEVSQLSNEVRSLNRGNVPAPIAITPVPTVPPRPVQPDLTNKQMFDRLATLVIELKERMNDVEARLANLEKQRAS